MDLRLAIRFSNSCIGFTPDGNNARAARFDTGADVDTTYVYDTQGRLIERTYGMGNLGGERSIYRYEDNDDPIEETTEHRSREATLGESETVDYTSDRLNIQHARFEYRYDAYGNWTERIVSIRLEPNQSFQRSNIERRAITYHAT
ncbi:MAG: hypothetical protein WA324_20615 [Bryobacteraceae bacterium]